MPGLITLKCPTCGANLRFEKGTQVFTCEHCGNIHLLEAGGQAFPASYLLPKREWMRVGDYDLFLYQLVDEMVGTQRVVYIEVEYFNPRANTPLSCRSNQWLLFDANNYSYETTMGYKNLYEDRQRPHFGSERFLNPGMRARGWLAFIVPADAQLRRLQFFTGFLSTKSVDILLDEG